MTPDEKARLRALADAATPGPWEAGEPSVFGDSDDKPQSCIDTPAGVLTWDDHGGEVFVPADAEFIAAARNALPYLLDALDQAERERDEARATKDMHKERAERIQRDIDAAVASLPWHGRLIYRLALPIARLTVRRKP